MRRVRHISKGLRIYRLGRDGSEVELLRHAVVKDGDAIRAVSSTISYGNKYYSCEVIDGRRIVGVPFRVHLDIQTRTSRERVDIWRKGGAVEYVSGKSATDYARLKNQLIAERKRGVYAEWKGRQIRCIFGAVENSRKYDDGGFDRVVDATMVANIVQFYSDGVGDLPIPKDSIEHDGQGYLVESVSKDIAVLTLNLSRDRGDY